MDEPTPAAPIEGEAKPLKKRKRVRLRRARRPGFTLPLSGFTLANVLSADRSCIAKTGSVSIAVPSTPLRTILERPARLDRVGTARELRGR